MMSSPSARTHRVYGVSFSEANFFAMSSETIASFAMGCPLFLTLAGPDIFYRAGAPPPAPLAQGCRSLSLGGPASPGYPPAGHPNAAAASGTPAGHPNAAAALGTPAGHPNAAAASGT